MYRILTRRDGQWQLEKTALPEVTLPIPMSPHIGELWLDGKGVIRGAAFADEWVKDWSVYTTLKRASK